MFFFFLFYFFIFCDFAAMRRGGKLTGLTCVNHLLVAGRIRSEK